MKLGSKIISFTFFLKFLLYLVMLPPCHRGSEVEHTLGKGGVGSSILPDGTIFYFPEDFRK